MLEEALESDASQLRTKLIKDYVKEYFTRHVPPVAVRVAALALFPDASLANGHGRPTSAASLAERIAQNDGRFIPMSVLQQWCVLAQQAAQLETILRPCASAPDRLVDIAAAASGAPSSADCSHDGALPGRRARDIEAPRSPARLPAPRAQVD